MAEFNSVFREEILMHLSVREAELSHGACGDGVFALEEIASLCGFEGDFRGNISTKFG